jgi:hypothetical protein
MMIPKRFSVFVYMALPVTSLLGSGCCMYHISETLIYKAKISSESCSFEGVKLYVSYKKHGFLLDSTGKLVDKYHEYLPDAAGQIIFKAGTTQSRCSDESPDYLHSAPLLIYFDHPYCADYYDSLPAARLKQLLRVTPEEAGYTLGSQEEGVWLLPTLHIEPDTAYFESED